MHGSPVRPLSVLAILLLAGAAPVAAQTTATGALELVVRGAAGLPLDAAQVELTHVTSGETVRGMTLRDGRLVLTLLAPGDYSGRVERLGFRPLQVYGFHVSADRTAHAALALQPAAPPVVAVDTLELARSSADGPGPGRVIRERELRGNPTPQRSLADLGVLSGLTGRDLTLEGLDPRRIPLLVNGVPLTLSSAPPFSSIGGAPFGLSSQSLSEVILSPARMDVEDPTGTGASWAVSTVPGFQHATLRTYGSAQSFQSVRGSGSELIGRSSGIGGGVLGGGTIGQGGPAVALGLEMWSDPVRVPDVLGVVDAARILDAARASQVDLTPFGDAAEMRTQSISGFARVDWLRTRASEVSSIAFLSASLPDQHLLSITPQLGVTAARSVDLFAASTVASQLASGLLNELRLGLTINRRSFAPARMAGSGDSWGEVLPETAIAGSGAYFGSNSRFPGDVRGTSLFASDALQFLAGGHRVKLGLQMKTVRAVDGLVAGRTGRFQFGGAEQFEQRTGAFYQVSGAAEEPGGSSGRVSAFLQDVWTASGVEAFAGLRVDHEIRPIEAFRPDPEWLRATAFAPEISARTETGVSPRAGIAWDPSGRGGVRIHLEAGVFHEMLDPAVITDLTRGDSASVIRWAGPIPEWPGRPAQAVSRRLAALAMPGLRSPRNLRTGGGVTAELSRALAFHIDLAFRHTDFLPRRIDLNRTTTPSGLDVHGRPLWGTLTKQGGLLLEIPGSSRRFAGYDVIEGISADGEASYVGVTVGLVGDLGSRLSVRGTYTRSSARDNAPSTRAFAPLTAPEAGESHWLTGPSDFDVPHRATLQLDASGPRALHLTVQGQYRSGLPFTPSFGPEVDANADGAAGNDPAYLDDAVAGYADLAGSRACLQDAGRFAARNRCRGPSSISLNARASIRLPGSGELYVDGYDLLGDSMVEPDPVLYRADAAVALGTDAATGRPVVPLRVNPNFGRALPSFWWGRTIRIGLQVQL